LFRLYYNSKTKCREITTPLEPEIERESKLINIKGTPENDISAYSSFKGMGGTGSFKFCNKY
jgi:hypothetical protein